MNLFVRLDDFKDELQGGREERGAPKNTALCLTGQDRLVTKQPSSALETFLVRFLVFRKESVRTDTWLNCIRAGSPPRKT